MEILVLCGIYLVELVCYWLGLKMLFRVRLRTWKWMVIGSLFPMIIGLSPFYVYGKNILIALSVFCVMFISIEGSRIEKGVKLLLLFLLLECINFAFVYFCDRQLLIYDGNYITDVNYLVVECCTAMSIVVFNIVREKMKHYRKTHINSIIYLLIGITIFLMMFCSTFLNASKIFLPNNNFMVFSSILSGAICISMLLLVGFVIYIKNTNEQIEQLLKTEQLLKELQVNYYRQILKKENDTRKYRHDMVNHLIYIQGILNKNKIEDAQKYLANILGGFNVIQNTYFTVGNEMVDTVMNYFFDLLSDKSKIEIRGKCPAIIDMKDTDICTVFSNILQNAVDEIMENSIKDAQIIVEVQKGQQYIEYTIKNSLASTIEKECIDKNGLPKSHKSDKKNHGIGMTNIKETVERNKGKFKWFLEEGYFCVNVILPIRVT